MVYLSQPVLPGALHQVVGDVGVEVRHQKGGIRSRREDLSHEEEIKTVRRTMAGTGVKLIL